MIIFLNSVQQQILTAYPLGIRHCAMVKKISETQFVVLSNLESGGTHTN